MEAESEPLSLCQWAQKASRGGDDPPPLFLPSARLVAGTCYGDDMRRAVEEIESGRMDQLLLELPTAPVRGAARYGAAHAAHRRSAAAAAAKRAYRQLSDGEDTEEGEEHEQEEAEDEDEVLVCFPMAVEASPAAGQLPGHGTHDGVRVATVVHQAHQPAAALQRRRSGGTCGSSSPTAAAHAKKGHGSGAADSKRATSQRLSSDGGQEQPDHGHDGSGGGGGGCGSGSMYETAALFESMQPLLPSEGGDATDVRSLLMLPFNTARKHLGLSKNAFKKLITKEGILRWPQRQLLGLKNLFLATADDPSLSEELREARMKRVCANFQAIMEGTESKLYCDLKSVSHVYHNRTHQQKKPRTEGSYDGSAAHGLRHDHRSDSGTSAMFEIKLEAGSP